MEEKYLVPTRIEFIFSQKGLSRREVKEKVVKKFFEEKPGPAEDGKYNKYTYLVEKTKEANINVVLIRPANLKLGFDFRIDVEGMTFSKGTHAPSHVDLFEDLKLKFSKDVQFCDKVIETIIEVINMKDPEEILGNFKDLNIGYSVELILKISKWFTIEQDIRYWNGWGRKKYERWIRLMRYYNFRYSTKKGNFYFYDNNGKKLTEDTAAKKAGIDRLIII